MYVSAGQTVHVAGIAEGEHTVRNSYHEGSISIGNGTIVSDCIGGTANECCYYLASTGSADYAKPLTETQMKAAANFVGFDFDEVWYFDQDDNYAYPKLRKEVEEIEWNSLPEKITYFTDSEISVKGGSVNVYYTDNTSETFELTGKMLSGYDLSVPGTQNVTVKCLGKELSYQIYVVQRPEIESMETISEPECTEFVKGTEIDLSGWVVRINYVDGSTEQIDVSYDMTDQNADISTIGNYTVTYSFKGNSVPLAIRVIRIQLSSIRIDTMPKQTLYVPGEPLNLDGMVVLGEKNNGDIEEITDYTVEGYTDSVGKQTLTISYSGFQADFDVEVKEQDPVALMITSMPDKTQYVEGQSFDPTGMVVKEVYNSGYAKQIDDYEISEIPSGTGTKAITVRKDSLTARVSVTVLAKELQSLMVGSLPDKTTYIEGETFDKEGLVIKGVYNDGSTPEITDYTISAVSTATIGKQNVYVLYGGKSVSFTIEVIEKTLQKIEAAGLLKTEYLPAEELELEGLEVTAWYDNGQTQVVDDYEISGYTGEPGLNIITVAYEGKSYSFGVVVHNPTGLWVETLAPTCESTGERVQYCQDCGEIVLQEAIDMLAHTPEIDKMVPATCTDTGLTEGSHCAVCGAVLEEQTVVDALGHDFCDWYEANAASCTAEGVMRRDCQRCGVSETDVIDIAEHEWEDTYTIDQQPTCTIEGSQSIHCRYCDATINSESIAVIPHDYDDEIEKAATCTDAGNMRFTCMNCGDTYTEVIPATGHDYEESVVAPTCEQTGCTVHTCAKCGDVYRDSYTLPIDHTYLTKVTLEPTCTATGKMLKVCSVCGATDTEEIKAKGHSYGSWYSALKPTCESTGRNERVCEVCESVESEEVEALGHQSGEGTIEHQIESTCTEVGSFEVAVYCSLCKKELTRERMEIPAKGHVEQKDDAVAATYTTTGLTEGSHCATCNEVLAAQDIIPIIKLKSPVIGLVNVSGGVKITWKKVTGATGYLVYRGSTKIATIKAGNTLAYTDTKANVNGTKYTYSIKAYAGKSSLNAATSGKAYYYFVSRPSVPGLSYKSGSGIKVSWKTNSKASGYQIKYVLGSAEKTVTVSGKSVNSKTISGVKAKKTYTVYLRTYKKVSGQTYYSAWSAAKTILTK